MAKKKSGGAAKDLSFEEALARLESIVRELEEADLPLEKSLAVFEEGIGLSRLLHEKLNESERKVEILLRDGSGAKAPVAFRGEGESAAAADQAAGAAGEADDDDDEADDGDAGAGGTGQAGLPF